MRRAKRTNLCYNDIKETKPEVLMNDFDDYLNFKAFHTIQENDSSDRDEMDLYLSREDDLEQEGYYYDEE